MKTNVETSDDDVELQPTHRARLCKLMLKLAGFDGNLEPGNFIRSHQARLDRVIREADRRSAKGRRQRAATHRDDEHDHE